MVPLISNLNINDIAEIMVHSYRGMGSVWTTVEEMSFTIKGKYINATEQNGALLRWKKDDINFVACVGQSSTLDSLHWTFRTLFMGGGLVVR